MMAGSYIDHALWGTVIGPDQFNPDSAIYRYWRSLKQADPPQYLGVPVTPEIQTEVGMQQGFASARSSTGHPRRELSLPTTNPVWAPALWVPNPWPELPEEPPYVEPGPDLDYDPWEVGRVPDRRLDV